MHSLVPVAEVIAVVVYEEYEGSRESERIGCNLKRMRSQTYLVEHLLQHCDGVCGLQLVAHLRVRLVELLEQHVDELCRGKKWNGKQNINRSTLHTARAFERTRLGSAAPRSSFGTSTSTWAARAKRAQRKSPSHWRTASGGICPKTAPRPRSAVPGGLLFPSWKSRTCHAMDCKHFRTKMEREEYGAYTASRKDLTIHR